MGMFGNAPQPPPHFNKVTNRVAPLPPTRSACAQSFVYLHMHVRDHHLEDILSVLPAAFVFIASGLRTGGVLVHCNAGRSRSAAIVMAFLMRVKGVGYDRVLSMAQRARSVVSPNKGTKRTHMCCVSRHRQFGCNTS